MYLYKETKKGVFKNFGYKGEAEDTGSPESQIALFTYRIQYLTDHLREHPKDKSTRIGLQRLVGKRRKMLDYLRRSDINRYRDVIKELGIRK